MSWTGDQIEATYAAAYPTGRASGQGGEKQTDIVYCHANKPAELSLTDVVVKENTASGSYDLTATLNNAALKDLNGYQIVLQNENGLSAVLSSSQRTIPAGGYVHISSTFTTDNPRQSFNLHTVSTGMTAAQPFIIEQDTVVLKNAEILYENGERVIVLEIQNLDDAPIEELPIVIRNRDTGKDLFGQSIDIPVGETDQMTIFGNELDLDYEGKDYISMEVQLLADSEKETHLNTKLLVWEMKLGEPIKVFLLDKQRSVPLCGYISAVHDSYDGPIPEPVGP